MSLGVNRLASSTTWVDSALLGSQAEASFCWALFSLPASGPASANTAIQKTRTPHLLLRPPGSPANRRAQLMTTPESVTSRTADHHRSYRQAGQPESCPRTYIATPRQPT